MKVIFFLFLLAFVLALYLWSHKLRDSSSVGRIKSIKSTIGDQEFILDVADTEQLRSYGLMNRIHLDSNAGMLFIFDMQGIYPFWMKNTLIPLDIIWLNSNKEVVYIKENAKPCGNLIEALCKTIIPNKIAKYVVELNSGKTSELGLKIGDRIEF